MPRRWSTIVSFASLSRLPVSPSMFPAMPSPRIASLACALAFLLPAPARTQSIPASSYSALRWRNIGPHRGGRVLAVAGIPGDAATYYFGSVDGGVWRTRNAGVTWESIWPDTVNQSIGALAIAPSDPNVIYAGTGESSLRSDITYGAGVFRSTDGGAHWTSAGLADTRHIARVLIDPRDPNIVLVAALGHAYGPNAERGVFRTTDGGRSWTKVLYKDENTGAIDLAADPAAPAVMYAALYDARRTPWEQYQPDEGPGAGIYKSSDGGVTWAPVSNSGLPAGPLSRIGLAVGRDASGSRVYALIGTAGGTGSGLYRSSDGTSWSRVSDDARLTSRCWYFCRITVDPQDPNIVYVPNVSLLRSTDGGATFTPLKGQPGGDDYHELWVDPRASARMVMGSDQGTNVSLDGGRTWSSWFNQPTAQFYHVITDDGFPYFVYGAQQDAGTVGIASRSDFGLITFHDWAPVGAGESGYIAPDPLHPDIIFGGDTYGSAFRFDRTTGQSHVITPWPIPAFGVPMPARKYRFTWTSPIVFDRVDKRVLYMGAQMVLRTVDGGLHWTEISPDLTGAASHPSPGTPPTVANAAQLGYGVVYTIAPSPLKAGFLWAGTDDGFIHRTSDGGKHWRNVTPAGIAPWSSIDLIEASPFDTLGAYAAVDRHRVDDLSPYIYRTHDGGAHWTRVTSGIAAGAYVHAVRADPVRRGLLYAGTEFGVYVSFDDGDHWQPLQLNLPVAAVRDLAVHDADLIAATHGRSFWILDDVSPLRQLASSTFAAPAYLFAPAPAIRLRRSESNDTPLPPEEPHGENPPAGAVIDYLLAGAPPGPVTIEIRDSRGKLVRLLSSDDSTQPHSAQPPQIAAEWLPRATPPTRDAGHNRFVWDLRYAPPPADYGYSIAAIAGQGTVAEPQGPLVLPGTYTVTLGVGGRTYSRTLRVRMDPRVHVPAAALESQLALAIEIWNALGRADALERRARALAKAISALTGSRLDSATQSALTSVALAEARIRRESAALKPPLGDLETTVLSADREPTAQARAVYAELSKRAGAAEQEWRALEGKDLPALNEHLKAQGIGPVKVPSIVAESIPAAN